MTILILTPFGEFDYRNIYFFPKNGPVLIKEIFDEMI